MSLAHTPPSMLSATTSGAWPAALLPVPPTARRLGHLLALTATLALAACGGGSGVDPVSSPSPVPAPAPAPVPTPPAPPPPASTTVVGQVVKGPVAGAQVCAYTVVANAKGVVLGACTTSDALGGYSLAVPAGSGLLWMEATGGTYTDEATGTRTTLPAGSALTALTTANGGSVTTMLTPLTSLALNAAVAAAAATSNNGSLNAQAFSTASAQLLSSFNLPASLDISGAQPRFGADLNGYGTALTVISQMVAKGTPLATILSTSNPQALAAAFAAAAAPAADPAPAPSLTPTPAPSPTTPVVGAGGGTASGSITHNGGAPTFVPRSAPNGSTAVFMASVVRGGTGIYNFFSHLRAPDTSGAYSLNGQAFTVTVINGALASLVYLESGTAQGVGRNLTRFCPMPCAGATVTTTADGQGLTLSLANARFETDLNSIFPNPPTTPIFMTGTLTGLQPAN